MLNLWGRSGRWARRVRTRVLVVTSTDHIRTWVAVQERDLRILKINQSISLIIINWLSWDNTFKREQRLMHLVWSNTDGSEWPMVWLCWTYSCGGFHASFPLVKAEGGDHSLCCSERCCWRSSPGSCHTQSSSGCGISVFCKTGFSGDSDESGDSGECECGKKVRMSRLMTDAQNLRLKLGFAIMLRMQGFLQ